MAIRINGQEPGNLGPPFRKRQVRHNATQGFRQQSPYDVTKGHHLPMVGDYDQVGLFTVLEERTDYLICEGLNPYTREWEARIAVAKPYALQITPFNGNSITIGENIILYDYSDDFKTRTVTTIDANDNVVSVVTQELSPSYFTDSEIPDVIAAIRTTVLSEDGSQVLEHTGLVERNAEGLPIDHTDQTIPESKAFPILWLDLNVGGKAWSTPEGIFPVKLEQSKGSAGDAESQCDWKYLIRLPNSEAILKADENIGLDPNVYRRPALGAMTKATDGTARYDNDDQLVVYWSNEVPEVSTCGIPAPEPAMITINSVA